MKKTKCTKDIKTMVENVMDSFYGEDFSIITKYSNARVIIKELLSYDDMIPNCVELGDSLYDGYSDEFIISVLGNSLYCEKAKLGGRYLNTGNSALFILDDASKECVDFYGGDNTEAKYVFLYSLKEDKAETDTDTNKDDSSLVIKSYDDDMSGFTKLWSDENDDGTMYCSISFYSNDSDNLTKIAKMFDVDF